MYRESMLFFAKYEKIENICYNNFMKKDNSTSTFSDRLREIRTAKGLTQTKLAEISGISRRLIVHYETHVKKPPIDKVNILADVLNVTVDELLGKTKKRKKNNIPFKIMKNMRIIESLPTQDQNAIFRLVKSLAEKNNLKGLL